MGGSNGATGGVIVTRVCPCCGAKWVTTVANEHALYRYVAARDQLFSIMREERNIDISRIPADIDWTKPVSEADLDRTYYAAFS